MRSVCVLDNVGVFVFLTQLLEYLFPCTVHVCVCVCVCSKAIADGACLGNNEGGIYYALFTIISFILYTHKVLTTVHNIHIHIHCTYSVQYMQSCICTCSLYIPGYMYVAQNLYMYCSGLHSEF